MINGVQNIAREALGKLEAQFLTKVAVRPTFSIEEARQFLRHGKEGPTRQFLERLQRKGWIRRIRSGKFTTIPLSSGDQRSPQLHEFLIAMELVSPAAVAYWSALNHHGMTEQIPRTVFVQTDHPVRRRPEEALSVAFKIISVQPRKFFGIEKGWINEQPFSVTDKEKTLIDGLDLPKYVGGVGEVAKALIQAWDELDETKLREYAAKIGNSAVAKRLGYLMEALGLGDPEVLRKVVSPKAGFSALDPTLPKNGKYNRRWGLLINAEIKGENLVTSAMQARTGYTVVDAIEESVMRSDRNKILRVLEKNREAIRAYGVRRLGLFGSFARDKETETSDLDFVVEFEKKSYDAYMDLKAFLEGLFKCRVDLVLADAIKPRLREVILKEAEYAPGL